MKTAVTISSILFICLSAPAQSISPAGTAPLGSDHNYPSMDVYATAPRELTGGGFGMGGYSPALRLRTLSGTGAELRVGGDFYFTGMDRRTLRGVPLLAPQTGAAKVRLNETMFGFNAVARLSRPWSDRISPYAEGFAGLRVMSTGITITPDQYQPGYEKTTSDNLDAACSFQYGAAAGVLVSVGRDLKLNAGMVYSRSERPGKLNDIHTASIAGSGIVMDKKPLNPAMVMFRLGITFRIDPSKHKSSSCDCCGHTSGGSAVIIPSGSGGASNRVGVGTRVAK